MSRRSIAMAWVLAGALAAVGAGAGCGVRTDPRPPEDTAARAPESLSAQASAGGVTIEWKRPTRSVDGQRLRDLDGFSIERRAGDGAFAAIANVPTADAEKVRPQMTYRYHDPDPPPGPVLYRVRALTADGQRSAPSAPALIDAFAE